ncbi:MAG: FtsX-like permease family protein, partial [Luteitalea sp.]|nr:FtsX-like permease family protein [Luteitalea sp.]
CIGANTAIFSVVNSVILRPLAVPEPDRIVAMWNTYPKATAGGSDSMIDNSAPDFFDRRALVDVFEEVAAYGQYGKGGYNIGTAAEPRRVVGLPVTPSFFPLLKVRPAIGRPFTDAEGEPGNNQVVVLSHGLWQELFAGDPGVLGRTLQLDGRPHTIVGVMPEGFMFVDPEVRLWTPLAFTPEQRQQYHNNEWAMIARLRRGASVAQAQSQIDALNARNMDRLPELKPLLINMGFHTPVVPLQEELVGEIRGILFLLWGGVTFVLLIGAVNVANLVLVRATARAPELATRVALGAPRGRLVGQMLIESLLLAVLGGALGLVLGWAGLHGLAVLGVETLPRAAEIRLDVTALVFTVGLALAVGLLVGLLPAVRVLRLRATSVLREEGRSGTASRGVRLVRQGLVVTQMAMALVLLVGGGVLLASFRQLLAIDPGFQPTGVLTAAVSLAGSAYPDDAARRAFADRVLARVRTLPGVETAGITNQIPFGGVAGDLAGTSGLHGTYNNSTIFAEGYVPQPGESLITASRHHVTPGYFGAMGIRVIKGRDFDSRDVAGGRQVIIIDERLAERFFPKGDAVGRRMWQGDPENPRFFDIVGVVRPIHMRGVLVPQDQNGAYYLPFMQRYAPGDFVITVRTAGDPQALAGPIQKVIAEIDAGLPVYDIRTMEERIARSLTDRRMPMLLTAAFALLALLLAAVGIYGVLASLVQRRTREIGIRMALGSDRPAIFRLVLREGVVMLGLGLIFGLSGAAALQRAIENHLYGVSPLDPRVLVLVVVLMSGAALAACLVPARRATRVDPASALAEP